MIIGFIIWSLIAVLFICIGISCRISNEAAGFFTGSKPPEVKDIKKYNHAVANLWFVSAVVYEILGIPLLFLEQNSAGFIPVIFATVWGMLIMAAAYLRIEAKYKK